ncbi:hypothetical protein [Bacillus solimangrovi]|uniref:Uncharacterized protein n=1 Tax=Bacillus solimangrovi TaxID=1305675 RepID=A0A1E5LAJ4_9BACI|nr:hypothetical protein [Bacillus solimangrovi]OEH91108.1 hypothetical protein BFG57_06980 [Bacillus solimangrovi]
METLIKMYGFLIFTSALSLIGFFKLKSSVDNGTDDANQYLRSMGGSMDSESYRLIEESYILSNITMGGIILFVGLNFLCFGIYKFFKQFD